MNKTLVLLTLGVAAVLPAQKEAETPATPPADPSPFQFELTPHMVKELEAWQKRARKWAADPIVVRAVQDANKAGPLRGMSDKDWKKLDAKDRRVLDGIVHPAAVQLRKRSEIAGRSAVRELLLVGNRGQSIAFRSKPERYLHGGQPSFDAPFGTRKAWRGEPVVDAKRKVYQIQVAVPVFAPREPGQLAAERKSIGALTVGIHLSHLARVAAAAAAAEAKAARPARPPR